MIKTVTTTAGVNTIAFPEFFKYFWIKNIGDTTVYASAFADVSAGVDNTSVINSGEAVCIENVDDDNVYISGAGSVEIHAQNNPDCPFKVAPKGGEIPDLSEYAKKSDIKNENLLMNPDFKINQRSVSGTFSETGKYFVDRWRLVSGAVTINADGTLTLNGTISQIFENAGGDNITASVSAGTATYDDSTKTFSITANGEIISWAKLEYGSVATEFVSPNASTELLKCQRYYTTGEYAFDKTTKNLNHAVIAIQFPVTMRITPTFIIYSYIGTVNTISYWASHNDAINDVYANVADISPRGLKSITSTNVFSEGETYSFKYTADAEIY